MLKQNFKKVFKFHKEPHSMLVGTQERPISSSTNHSKNDFLVEIEHNYDIDRNIRHEIETRFKKSAMNANYKFPRAGLADSKGLPKIKFDKGRFSENETTITTSERKRYRVKKTEKSLNERFKIPGISKKKFIKERRDVGLSVTPSPYVMTLKGKDSMHIHDIKRSTPSPIPRNTPLSFRLDRSQL